MRPHALRIALHEPDLAPNFGAMLRLAACLGAEVEVIEPCGFPLDDRRIRRSGMDYLRHVRWHRHPDFATFQHACRTAGRRIIALSRHAHRPYHRFTFAPTDVLLLGAESRGLPAAIQARADAVLAIPLRPGLRSLNLVTAAAIVLAEALRQLGVFDVWSAHD